MLICVFTAISSRNRFGRCPPAAPERANYPRETFVLETFAPQQDLGSGVRLHSSVFSRAAARVHSISTYFSVTRGWLLT